MGMIKELVILRQLNYYTETIKYIFLKLIFFVEAFINFYSLGSGCDAKRCELWQLSGSFWWCDEELLPRIKKCKDVRFCWMNPSAGAFPGLFFEAKRRQLKSLTWKLSELCGKPNPFLIYRESCHKQFDKPSWRRINRWIQFCSSCTLVWALRKAELIKLAWPLSLTSRSMSAKVA